MFGQTNGNDRWMKRSRSPYFCGGQTIKGFSIRAVFGSTVNQTTAQRVGLDRYTISHDMRVHVH